MYWKIKNFKGLSEGKINFSEGHLTLLTGANSSGKSSLIQSLLLFSQSWKDPGPILLNGSMTRLGDPEDIFNNEEKTIELSIENESAHHINDDPIRFAQNKYRYEISLGIDNASNELKISKFEIYYANSDSKSLQKEKLILSASTPKNNVKEVKDLKSKFRDPGINILRLDYSDKRDKNYPNKTFIIFSGFIPVCIAASKTPTNWEKMIRKGLNNELNDYGTNPSIRKQRSFSLSIPFFDFSLDYVYENHEEFVNKFPDIQLPEELNNLDSPNNLLDLIYKSPEGTQRLFIDWITEKILENSDDFIAIDPSPWYYRRNMQNASILDTPLNQLFSNSLRKTYSDAARGLQRYIHLGSSMADGIQYLGPLRDEPRVIWNVSDPKISGLPVGAKGEYSSAILAKKADSEIAYRRLNSNSDTKESLKKSLNYWVDYLGIGESISAESKGKLGTSLTIEVGGKTRDLTAVGVGVSQTLPVVIALLTVPKNSIFLVEQPELHLHPHVQSQLADFLLTVRPDVSLIIETHSEALVTRIRRRVVEGIHSPKDISIIFVEQDKSFKDKRSVTSELEINDYGDLERWPEGFLKGPQEDYLFIMKEKGKLIQEKLKKN